MKKDSKSILKRLGVFAVSALMCCSMLLGATACTPGDSAGAPYIGSDGYWYVNGQKTDYRAEGKDGKDGQDGKDGKDGLNGSAAAGDIYEASPKLTEKLFTTTGTPGNFQYKGKFYSDYATLEEAWEAGHALGVQIAAEGDVLLKNEGEALPLKATEKKVTLLGIRSARMIRSGFGSGSGGGSAISTLLGDAMSAAGYSVNPKPLELYTKEVTQMVEDRVVELDPETYGPSIVNTYASYADAAIITLSRTGAENYDLATNNALGHANEDDHALQLMDNEAKLIKHAKKHFKKVIVLINSSNIMQIPELNEKKTDDNYGVDAILWVGGVGQDGATAIAHILNGDITPSGHTVDLWEKDFKKSPTWTNFGPNTQNKDSSGNRLDTFYYDKNGNITKFANLEYREGIYSGYRFYETAYADADGEAAKAKAYENVLYPYGYGLSYTDFEWKIDNIEKTANITAANSSVTMRVWVKNVGTVAGKDVVQVYYAPPYKKGGIEKSAANLIGFAKTKLLQPGESDVVTIEFAAQEMASFDWNDANKNGFKGYELEAGDYTISVNRNSHEVVDSVTRTITSDIKCTTDLVTGKEIKPVYTGSFDSTNESLLTNMISRANGLKQPAAATKKDRTLDDATLADYESQATYYSYQDKETDPWYVKKLPSTWNQAPEGTTDAVSITLADMAGVTYTEPVINDKKEVVLATDENSKKWENFMNQFTWSELCSLPANPDNTIPRLGAISVDGNGNPRYTYSDPDGPINAASVQFPSNPILAATYNSEIAYEMGRIVGNLLLLNGSRGWRGAGADIHRSPFSGRNFEYYSEDGVMSGLIGAEVAAGVTSKGIIAHFKHFFGNDQETYRADYGGVFTWATEQTLREITAKPFEYIVKKGGSIGLMTSFNRIGKWTQTTNYATHESLLNQEWDFQGSTESDAWAKQFVPANLMVRGGDDELLTRDSSFPQCALERGTWDETAKCVRVAANAEEYTAYDSGAGTMLSPTHYFAVRKCAQRLLQTLANSSVNNNGLGEEETVLYTLTKGIYNSIQLSIPGKTSDATFTFAEDAVWPAGMTYDAATGLLKGVPTGENAADVTGKFDCDSWIKNKNVTFKFAVQSDLTVNGKNIVDGQKINVARNSAYTATIAAASLRYGNQLAITARGNNMRIMNAYMGLDGSWYHRDEDKSAADIVTLGNTGVADLSTLANLDSSKIYGYKVEGLPAGLTAEYVMTNEMGWAGRSAYAVNTSVKISGNCTAEAGEYTVTITLNVPYVSKGTNPWMRAAGTTLTQFVQTITIVVA